MAITSVKLIVPNFLGPPRETGDGKRDLRALRDYVREVVAALGDIRLEVETDDQDEPA